MNLSYIYIFCLLQSIVNLKIHLISFTVALQIVTKQMYPEINTNTGTKHNMLDSANVI